MSGIRGRGSPGSRVLVPAQDSAFWLPVVAWIGTGLWNADPRRIVLAAGALAFWVLEAASVAADQWWGHHADPSSRVVSPGAAVLFVVVGLVTAWPLVAVLNAVRSTPDVVEVRPPSVLHRGRAGG